MYENLKSHIRSIEVCPKQGFEEQCDNIREA